MKKLAPFLIVAVILRLFLMSISLHPDFKAYNLAAYFIAQKGEVFTFYDHISKLPRTDPLVGIYGDGQFNYPPLAYLSHGLFNLILGPIYPWNAFQHLIYDFDSFRGSKDSVQLLILLKLPYLVADLVGLWLIRKMASDKEKFGLSLLWLFNPINLYSAYLMGQFDIFIGVLIVLAIVLNTRHKTGWSAVALGLASSFKPFPLIMLPFLPGNKVKNILLGLGTYVVTILPYLSSVAFKHYALLASQSDKPLYAKIMVSGSQYLPLFVVGVVLLWWWHYFSKKTEQSWIWLSAPLLLFFSLTHFHPQWMAWLTPFLCLAWLKNKSVRLPIITLLVSYLVVIFSFDPSLNLGLIGINYDLLGSINKYYSLDQIVSIFRGILAASGTVVFYRLWASS